MVAQAPSSKKPLPEMLTSIRLGQDGLPEIIDQLLLPHEVTWLPVKTTDEAFDAIRSMKIRGAPAIASLAALSLAYHLRPSPSTNGTSSSQFSFSTAQDLSTHLHPILDHLQASRPTAVNLSEALNRIRTFLTSAQQQGLNGEDARAKVREICKDVHGSDLRRCIQMGKLGAEWLWQKRGGSGKQGLKVLTVCNTGSLATSGYGTAIGVITALFEEDQLDRAYYAQTTPYHQGSRLTSLELTTLQMPASMICDTMIGSLMQHHDIDGVIVGADRIVRNGDTANKIGTYQAAVLAQRHGVPFMVVAPVTTVDLSLATGSDIHIEHRPSIEATLVRGRNIQTGSLDTVRITPEGVGEGKEIWQGVYNPSFDVTPADLISCIVTEKGVAERKEGETAIDVSSVC